MKHIRDKIMNRETITYGVVGFMTTAVNFLSYEFLYRILHSNLVANCLAWVIATAFAYVANKWKVFDSTSQTIREEIIKIGSFIGARLMTLGIEQLGMYILVEQMGIYRWIVKGTLGILVIVINYIFSKLFIFRKKDRDINK